MTQVIHIHEGGRHESSLLPDETSLKAIAPMIPEQGLALLTRNQDNSLTLSIYDEKIHLTGAHK